MTAPKIAISEDHARVLIRASSVKARDLHAQGKPIADIDEARKALEQSLQEHLDKK